MTALGSIATYSVRYFGVLARALVRACSSVRARAPFYACTCANVFAWETAKQISVSTLQDGVNASSSCTMFRLSICALTLPAIVERLPLAISSDRTRHLNGAHEGTTSEWCARGLACVRCTFCENHHVRLNRRMIRRSANGARSTGR